MNLRSELLVAIGALALLNLALAFGAIGLFVRMGPAIEGILEENVYTIVAAETILGELAQSGFEGALDEDQKEAISRALKDAEQNITEAEERPIIADLRNKWSTLAPSDVAARKAFIVEVQRLIQVNRQAMVQVDLEAKRLGSAGAWSAVFIGFFTFLLSLLVLTRLQRRFVRPLLELYEVVSEAEQGQGLRRCRSVGDAPIEVLQVAREVNRLLDERLSHAAEVR